MATGGDLLSPQNLSNIIVQYSYILVLAIGFAQPVGTSGIYAGAMVSNVARFSKNIATAVVRLGTVQDLERSTRSTADDIGRRAVTSARPESFGVTRP